MTYRPQFNHGDLEMRAAQYEAEAAWMESLTSYRMNGYHGAVVKVIEEMEQKNAFYVPVIPDARDEYTWEWQGANVWSFNYNDVICYASWSVNGGYWSFAIVDKNYKYELMETGIRHGAGLWGTLAYSVLRELSEITQEWYSENLSEGAYDNGEYDCYDDCQDEAEFYEDYMRGDSDLMNEW